MRGASRNSHMSKNVETLTSHALGERALGKFASSSVVRCKLPPVTVLCSQIPISPGEKQKVGIGRFFKLNRVLDFNYTSELTCEGGSVTQLMSHVRETCVCESWNLPYLDGKTKHGPHFFTKNLCNTGVEN